MFGQDSADVAGSDRAKRAANVVLETACADISRRETVRQAPRAKKVSHSELVSVAQFSHVAERRGLKASYLLVQNIRSLLIARGEDDKALAMWAGHRPAWISKILSSERGIKLKDLDKIADFFGLTVAQLFQHGISPLTERRKKARRSGQDRRTGIDRRGSGDHRLHPELGSPFRRREHQSPDGDGHHDGRVGQTLSDKHRQKIDPEELV